MVAQIAKVGIWDIEYSVTEENTQYGLEVVQKEGEKIITQSKAFPLTKNKEEAVNLAKLFCENDVFPTTLENILEDLGYFQ